MSAKGGNIVDSIVHIPKKHIYVSFFVFIFEALQKKETIPKTTSNTHESINDIINNILIFKPAKPLFTAFFLNTVKI